MENLDSLERTFSDALLSGRFTYSTVVTHLGNRTNQYGEPRVIEATLISQMAEEIVSFVKGGDKHVARGIALGIVLGNPTYENMGEEFLKEKIPGYKKSGLGVALTAVMLNELCGKRIDRILKGVEDALDGKEDISEEAKAAEIACRIYNAANKRNDRDMFNSVSTMAFGKVIRATGKNGTVTSVDYIDKIDEKESEKDLIVRTPKQKEELENAYDYYCKNYSEIPEEFTSALDGYSTESIVAYYVASMRELALMKLYSAR